jgi:hypothetical protein
VGVCYNMSCSICDKIDYYKNMPDYKKKVINDSSNLDSINQNDYEDDYRWAESL